MRAALVVLILLAAPPARAHKPSDSSLTLDPQRGTGRWEIAIRDLDDTLVLDADGNGAVTWGELRGRLPEIAAYALPRLVLRAPDGPCPTSAGDPTIVARSDGAYLSLPLAFSCRPPLQIEYALFFDRDPLHRAIVHIEGGATTVLHAGDRRRTLPAGAAHGSDALTFVGEGVRHIAGGIDHLLFLLALLLPAVLRREPGGWRPVPAIRPALVDVARIVTAFTAAHSLTLTLAALGLVRLPSRLVEPAIAASVLVAAVNNLRPMFGADRWVVAFALGLLHGFGFSSVLADVGLAPGRLLPALLGFNVGVELGQLAAVGLFVPVAFLLRRTAGYRRIALVGGSAAIAALSVVWFVERALDVSLFG